MQETLQQVKTRACVAHGFAPEAVLLWDFFLDSKYVLLEDQLHCSLAELHMQEGQPLLLEHRHVSNNVGVRASAYGCRPRPFGTLAQGGRRPGMCVHTEAETGHSSQQTWFLHM